MKKRTVKKKYKDGKYKMQPYGVDVIAYADIMDIQIMGAKSSYGKFPEKSGDYKSYTRSKNRRKWVRRKWKSRARRLNKQIILEEILLD